MSYPKSNFAHHIIGPVSRKTADPLVQAHYLHRWPGVVMLILGMKSAGEIPIDWSSPVISGVIVFALPPRETVKRYGVSIAWELARLFVLDSEPFNAETWFMAQAIRYIRKYYPQVELLVSYADPSANHKGVIYKAANWREDGRTDQERKTPRFDYAVGSKIYSRRAHVPDGVEIRRVPRVSKFRFVYWMNRRM